MFYVARMYSNDQWQFEQLSDVIDFFYTDLVHENHAIVVEQHEQGVRAWIGTDFLQRFEDDDIEEDEELEQWFEALRKMPPLTFGTEPSPNFFRDENHAR